MTTTSIMKKLAQRMSQNVQTFPDPKQREAIVTDMLLGVIKTGKLQFETCTEKKTFFFILMVQYRIFIY